MADDIPGSDAGGEPAANEPVAGQRSTGRVKWFNNTKGFGFIVADGADDSSDLFAHYSAIEMNGYRTLKAGQHVSFTTADGPKGLHAMDIRSADEAIDDGAESAGGANASDSVSGDAEHPGIDVELPDAAEKEDNDAPLPGSSAAQR